MKAASQVSYHKGWNHAETAAIGVWPELEGLAKNIQDIPLSRNLIILKTAWVEKYFLYDIQEWWDKN